MPQLQLIGIDDSDVNPPKKNHSHMEEPWLAKPAVSLTLKTVAIICNFSCTMIAMISPHYHALSSMCTYNLMIMSQSHGHTYLCMVKRMTSLC